jgi:hypothetical protein
MAKFKIGDEVFDPDVKERTYVVTGKAPDYNGREVYLVRGSDGMTIKYLADDLSPMSRAPRDWIRNSKHGVTMNAGEKDFNKGDRVRSRVTGKVGTVTDFKDSFVPGGDKIQLWTRDYFVKWDGDVGEKLASQSDLVAANSTRSTNPVVANAMKANGGVARNADLGSALKDAISACRRLAEIAKKEGNEEEHRRAVKAGTALYGMKPAW